MEDIETSSIYAGKFYHAHPQTPEGNHTTPPLEEANQYFKPVLPETPGQQIVAVIIPFYNETWAQLNSTLDSLQHCQNLVSHYIFSYFLIQDGWNQAPACMKKELKRTFPHDLYWKELKNPKVDEGRNVTYIFQTTTNDDDQHCGRNSRMKKHITLLVKKDNRKKHNSHQWFFSNNGFCGAMNPSFCFATDCSTLYDENCLKLLLDVMQREENCAVVTGRQVVMTARQQGTEDTLIESLFRSVQCYDFESSFAAFMGAFAIFGFLPVVPGPCGLYRWSDMKGIPLEWYFEIVNRSPNDCGLVLSNLKIAEDRILSYAAVLKTARTTKMCMHPDAEFYFESETDLAQFVKQRRRWINGTVAGYVYLCAHAEIIFESKLSLFHKVAVYFLILCQTGMYGIVFLAPAIFLSMLYSTVMWMFARPDSNNLMPFAIFIAYVGFYIWFMTTHAKQARENVFVGWMFYTMLLISVITMVGMFAGITYYMITKWSLHDIITSLPLTLAICVVAFPIVISFHRPMSTWRCLKSCVPFYLFLPTLVAWFGCYSVARFWDITWGNRPAGGHAEAALDAKRSRMLVQAQTFSAIVLVANLLVILSYVQTSESQYFLFVASILICCFSTLQMILSFLYFFLHFLMDKVVFKIPELLLEFTHKLLSHEVFTSIPDAQPATPKAEGQSLLGIIIAMSLTFWQLAVNFAYQTVMQRFQEQPVVDSHDFITISAAFPPLGLVSIFIGFFGDKFNKKQTNVSFKVLAGLGCAIFVVTSAAMKDYDDYTDLLVRTCIQLFGLHVINSACFALFLKYANPSKLLSLILLKSLLGVVGNLIPSIVDAVVDLNDYYSWTLELTSLVLLCLFLFMLMLATSERPSAQLYKPPPTSVPLGYDMEIKVANQHYRAAIVLSAFFFFGVALAPMQFDMLAYFEEMPIDEQTALDYSLYGFIGQEAVVFIVACITLCFSARKGVLAFLTLTSLIQLLFLIPSSGTNPILGLFIISACGFYRTYVDVFAYYFFAACVHGDISHIGFWVAGLNVTVVAAQLTGGSLIGQLALSHDFRTLFGYAGLSCVFGIASAWRIYSPATRANASVGVVNKELVHT